MLEYRADFEAALGKPFEHFYCPILDVDQPSKLCLGHIVNDSIEGSSKKVVLQREDVDNFYGSAFEADFVAFTEMVNASLDDAMIDPKLSKKAQPKLEMDGNPIETFPYSGNKAGEQILVRMQGADGRTRDFVMKIHQQDHAGLENRTFRLVVDRDFRITALVSLLKAAHLSLFHRLGYEYVFTAAGEYLGKGILGKFFHQAIQLGKAARVEAARKFFTPLCNMVRPMLNGTTGFNGFLDDGCGYVCLTGDEKPFALGVVVRTSEQLHSVLLPADPKVIHVYFGFLSEPPPELAIRMVRWIPEQNSWSGSKEIQRVPFTNAFA